MTSRATANGIEIAYETFGSPDDRPMLLVMGLGSQMVLWEDEWCEMLAAHGHHVVRFDNRDVGLSTHLHHAGVPDLTRVMAGDRTAVPYLIDDMADDAAGLMDALGWRSAHVVGASMGGMIAQALAIRCPGRVRSITSIMSTPDMRLSPPTDEALAALMSPAGAGRDDAVARAIEVWSVIGSPGYPLDRERISHIAGLAYDRGTDPAGSTRQLAAIIASPDRTPALGRLDVPALVVHGKDDPLIPVAGGMATAEAIPGARLMTFPGMAHDLPRPLWDQIIPAVARLTATADRAPAF